MSGELRSKNSSLESPILLGRKDIQDQVPHPYSELFGDSQNGLSAVLLGLIS